MNNTIYYDANFAIGSFRGMGKFINNFTKVLENEFNFKCIGLLKKGTVLNSNNYHSFGFKIYILWEQFSLFYFQNNNNNNCFVFPYNTAPIFIKPNKNNVLIVHDLIFMNSYKSASLKQIIGNLYRRFVLPRIIKKFNHIITVSSYSKDLIINKFNIDKSKIHVIYNCIDISNYNFENNPNFLSRENTIFHLGGEPDYKNTETVIKAFSIFTQKFNNSYILKIVGIRNSKSLKYFTNICNLLGIQNQVEFLPFQTDSQIEDLYKTSKFFIIPSKEEGFGIPIIESLKFGCPLISSNASCLPEIAGNAALYFDPNSIIQLCNSMIYLLTNISDTEKRILFGYEQIKIFSFMNFNENVKNWVTQNYE